MKIVTVNIPESYIEAIEKLIGENGLYPSRSELIRVSVREFLLKELKMAKNMAKYNEPEFDEAKKVDAEDFVKVPIDSKNDKDEPVTAFKTYKIIKRLDYNNKPTTSKKPSEIKIPETHAEMATKRKDKKGEKILGNPFWESKLDETGNLIQVPKEK